MSDLSCPHCKTCGEPDYACDCEDSEFAPPAIQYVLKGERIPDNHPFRLNREKHGLPMYGEEEGASPS